MRFSSLFPQPIHGTRSPFCPTVGNVVSGLDVRRELARALVAVISFVVGCAAQAGEPAKPAAPDIVVVGAGIAGLSSALEAGRSGANVLVLDMSSVFGGHAVMAQGLLNITGTPDQAALGIVDSPELAERDFLAWGVDADPGWVRYYTRNSRVQVFDWLTGMGVSFGGVSQPPGNSVPRAHSVQGRGMALIAAIYRECLNTPTITFQWNVRLDKLLKQGDRVIGVATTDLRTGQAREIRARSGVVLATGGFQSNLTLVRENWPNPQVLPARILAGSGVNSRGSALALAREVGAAIERLDRQWNYLTGVPDPRFPGSDRGVFLFVPSIWVNREGRRFTAENPSPKDGFASLLAQPGGTSWAIFGPESLPAINVSGSDWADFKRVEELIIRNPAIVKRGETLEELGAKTGLPAEALRETLQRFNTFAARGVDEDFGALHRPRLPIGGPPYYAIQQFPLARKSLGGIAVDGACRVLDTRHEPIRGLFAAGEVSGFGGINGQAGLEGTFLAPALVQGRVAARTIMSEMGRKEASPPTGRERVAFRAADAHQPPVPACLQCHALAGQVEQPRPGFWHFEKVHKEVLSRRLSCANCHAEIATESAGSTAHQIDSKQLMLSCAICHQGEAR